MLHLQTLSSTFQNIYYIARNILGGLGYEKIDGLHIVAKTDRKNEASMSGSSGSNFGAWTIFVLKIQLVAKDVLI